MAAIADDAAVAADHAAAQALDALLDEWAGRGVRTGDPAAAAARVLRPPRTWLRVAGGGSIAAAVALVALLGNPLAPHRAAPPPRIASATASPPAAHSGDDAAFATLFTPTPDEELTL